jgi:hypothetical protein
MIPSHKLDVGSMKRTLVAHGLLRDQVSETLLAKARQRLAHCERTDERIERLVASVNLLLRDVAQQRLRFFDSAPRVKDLLGKKATFNTNFPYLLDRTP